jgi:hypothetical protein
MVRVVPYRTHEVIKQRTNPPELAVPTMGEKLFKPPSSPLVCTISALEPDSAPCGVDKREEIPQVLSLLGGFGCGVWFSVKYLTLVKPSGRRYGF